MSNDDGTKHDGRRDEPSPPEKKDGARSNAAPDAVKDPNEKTDGKPGHPGQGDEVDPGGG